MSKEQDLTNIGLLFKNNRKQSGDRLPDYNGTIALPDGTQMEISGWLKETAKGDKFLSLALKEPWQGGQSDRF